MDRFMVSTACLLVFAGMSASPVRAEIDFASAVEVMKAEYQGFFDRSREDFGTTSEAYHEQMEALGEMLLEEEIIWALWEDPWEREPAWDEALRTVDVLALYSWGVEDDFGDVASIRDRIRTEEMFANIAFERSGLPLRYRFKILPLHRTMEGEVENFDADEYREHRGRGGENLNRILAVDRDVESARDRWGADLVLLLVSGEERIYASKGQTDGCGSAVRPQDPPLLSAVATLTDDGFCAGLFTSTHELAHLFGVDHPREPHESRVEDEDYPLRFSLMGYRNGICEDRKPECLRTLSFVEGSRRAILGSFRRISAINDAMRWP